MPGSSASGPLSEQKVEQQEPMTLDKELAQPGSSVSGPRSAQEAMQKQPKTVSTPTASRPRSMRGAVQHGQADEVVAAEALADEFSFIAFWKPGSPAPIPSRQETRQRTVLWWPMSKHRRKLALAETYAGEKRYPTVELLESFLAARPHPQGTLLDYLGRGVQVRDIYSKQNHLTVTFWLPRSTALEDAEATHEVHGTCVSNLWSILVDDHTEPSRENVLMRKNEPVEGVYAHTSGNRTKWCGRRRGVAAAWSLESLCGLWVPGMGL